MFGLFDSELKRVRKLRLGYEDIRQRLLYKMNPYQQYAFISGYHATKDQFKGVIDSIPIEDTKRWQKVCDELSALAQRSWDHASRTSGIEREGATVTVDAVLLLAVECGAKGYRLAEALTLRDDIASLVADLDKWLAERENRG